MPAHDHVTLSHTHTVLTAWRSRSIAGNAPIAKAHYRVNKTSMLLALTRSIGAELHYPRPGGSGCGIVACACI